VFLRGGSSHDGAGTLGAISGGTADTLTFQNTGSNVSETTLMAAPEGQQGNRRVFLSPVLTEDVRLSGTAVLNLRAAFGTSQSNLSGVIVDYGTGNQTARSPGDGVQNTTTRTCWGATNTDNNACPTLGAECTTTGIGVDNACYLEVSKRIGPVDSWRVTRGTIDSRQRNSFWYQDASPVEPNAFNSYSIPMQPTEHIFKAGHRIAIVVTANLYGSGASTQLGLPSAVSAAQPVTLDTRQSKIMLPLVGGAQALFESGAFTDPQGTVGGTVPATLALTLGTNAMFDPFIPGIGKEYTASTTANVISTAADATLTVSDASTTNNMRLVNGAFALAEPLRVEFSKAAWTGPVSNDSVNIAFKQLIKANDPLRTGTYSKTLTFTLSTTTP
jgi:X-Pro dipeptidyl-peptidase